MTRIKKKAVKVHDKYLEPHRKNQEIVNRLDKTMVAIGLIGSTATIIQVLHIYQTKNVGGISLISWFLYLTVAISWASYGFFHRSKPLTIINSLAILTHLSIISGYLIYK